MNSVRKASRASSAARPPAPSPATLAQSEAATLSSSEPQAAERRKAAQAFRTIAEVSEELGIAKHVLRFWEVKFTQLRPMKRGGGRRFYRPDDVELLRGIRHLLQAEAFTIKGVQKILREQGVEVVKRAGDQPAATAVGARSSRRSRVGATPATDALPALSTATSAARANGVSPVESEHGDTAAIRSAVQAAIRELEALRATLVGAATTGNLGLAAGDAP